MAGAPEVAMRGIKAWLETELPPQQRRNFSIFKCDFLKTAFQIRPRNQRTQL